MHLLPQSKIEGVVRVTRTKKSISQAFALSINLLQASVFLWLITTLAQPALGQQCVSAGGAWSTAGSWTCTGGATPPPSGTFTGSIVIRGAVTMGGTQTISGLTVVDIVAGGQLSFSSGDDLVLSNSGSKVNLYNSSALVSGGNGSSQIIIGGNVIFSGGGGGFGSGSGLPGPLVITSAGSSTVLVNSLTLTAATSGMAACTGNSVSLSVNTSGGSTPYSFSWVAPAGATVSPASASITSATVTTTGLKTFTVTVTDAAGRTNSTTLAVTGTAFPAFTSLTTTQGSLPYCVSVTRDVINISTTVTNGTTYTVIGPDNTAGNNGGTTWTTFGSSASATGTLTGSPASFSVNRDAAVARSGTYTIIVGNAGGCRSTTTISVTVASTPVVVTIPPGGVTATICSSAQPISITANTTGGSGSYSYVWQIAPNLSGGTYVSYPGSTSVISTSVLTAFTSGTAAARYRVQVTDVVSLCPSVEDVVPVLVYQTPSVSLSANGPITCAQTAITLTATATGGVIPYSYTFSGPGLSPTASTSMLVVSAAQEGSYTVTVSAAGCPASATTTVTSNTTPPGITQNGSTTHVTCNGLENGALSVDVTGGFPLYAYGREWLNRPRCQQWRNGFVYRAYRRNIFSNSYQRQRLHGCFNATICYPASGVEPVGSDRNNRGLQWRYGGYYADSQRWHFALHLHDHGWS